MGIVKNTRKYQIAFAAFFLMLLVYLFWAGARTSPTSGKLKLAVAFVCLTNSPPRQMVPTRIALSERGATGLCAMFVVTNVGGTKFWKDAAVWFETASVEQKTAAGWQPVPQDSQYWSGIEGRVWTPGYGCLYAVGWPPGVPTNAAWRLLLRYGREASAMWTVANDKLGHGLLPKGKEEQTIPSSEVTQ
ncbi:MAG TPA: hypothetical protein VFT34_17420 [Verrucomicrobiae bacterium]|nr:hypothetical protein [Verrucomicrobiae bacterium]